MRHNVLNFVQTHVQHECCCTEHSAAMWQQDKPPACTSETLDNQKLTVPDMQQRYHDQDQRRGLL